MIENLEDVILFAANAHKEQKMFEPDVPYITHVFGVASNVLEAYYNGEEKFDLDYALKVAILHDTIEDTDVCYGMIAEKYGEEIATGVQALSKNPLVEKSDRMKDCMIRIKECKKEVAIVKLADRVFNMRCAPTSWNDEKLQKYLDEAQMICNDLGDVNKYLKEKLESRMNNYTKSRITR